MQLRKTNNKTRRTVITETIMISTEYGIFDKKALANITPIIAPPVLSISIKGLIFFCGDLLMEEVKPNLQNFSAIKIISGVKNTMDRLTGNILMG